MSWVNSVLPTYTGASGHKRAENLARRPFAVQVGDTPKNPWNPHQYYLPGILLVGLTGQQ
jgi:hypothetical protein